MTGRRSSKRSRSPPGYEQALGAALGDDLDAASDETAPSHWRLTKASASDPALPDGATPLSQFVKGAGVLRGRLAQIGVVEAGAGPRASGHARSRASGWCPRKAISGAGTATASRPARQAPPARGWSSAAAWRRSSESPPRRKARAAEAEAELQAARARAEAAQLKTKALRQEAKEAHAELDRDARSRSPQPSMQAQASSKALGALAEALSRTRAALDEAEMPRRAASPPPCSSSPRLRGWRRRSRPRKPSAGLKPPGRGAGRRRARRLRARSPPAAGAAGGDRRRGGACGGSASPMRASRS